MEGSERHLRTRFADGLGGNYSGSLAGLHESTLVILYSLKYGLVNSRFGQFRVYQALAQLVEYQGREGIVRLVNFILNVLLGRGSSLLHRKPDTFYQTINVDSLAMITLGRIHTILAITDLDYVSSGISDGRVVFDSEVLKGVD